MKQLMLFMLCGMVLLGMKTSVAYADINDLAGIGNAAHIVMNPAHPHPGETVHLSVESAVLDVADSDIVWNKNGTQLVGGQGIVSVDVVAGALGSEMDIKVNVTATDGTGAQAQVAIIPTEVDLLFSADSLTPPFYRGKALPSGGSTVHLWAIARLKTPNGGFVSSKNTIYTWRQDGQVLGSVSGRGKESLTMQAPFPRSKSLITVEAHDDESTVSGTGSVTIGSIDPVVRTYEDHPLFGIRYGTSLDTTIETPDTELTLAVIPFFANTRTADDTLLTYDWTVNGRSIQTTGKGKNEITLGGSHDKSIAKAHVTLELSHETNPFLGSSNAWDVVLNGSSGANMFTTEPKK